jgi:hypothetical protein
MKRVTLAAFALLFAVTGLVMASGAEARASESNVPSWAWEKTWDRCESDENSRNCVWNAKRQGNGTGRSYIASTKGRIIRIEHYEAYRLTHHIVRLIYMP